jgi:hypothetical protein
VPFAPYCQAARTLLTLRMKLPTILVDEEKDDNQSSIKGPLAQQVSLFPI